MHRLRYVLGTNFLRIRKQLATDPVYTYDHFVTTTNAELLFSKAAGYFIKIRKAVDKLQSLIL